MTDLDKIRDSGLNPEDYERLEIPVTIEEHLSKICEGARDEAIEEAEKYGVSVNAEDWNYWRIYAKDIDKNSIGLNLAEMHRVLDYLNDNMKNERGSSLFYSKVDSEIVKFCRGCRMNCDDCNVHEFRLWVGRRI